jgi:hypothetical protein
MSLCSRLAVLAACLLLPSLATAGDLGWYVGFDMGRARATDPALFSAGTFSYTSGNSDYNSQLTPPTYEQTDSAHRIALGFAFNRIFGMEVTDVDLGSHVAHAHGVSAPLPVSCGLPCENSFDASPHVDVVGTGIALTAAWPLSQDFSLVARYGRFSYRADYGSGITPTNGGTYGNANLPPSFGQSNSDTTDMYGFGLGWMFVEHWALRANWDEYLDVTGGSTTFDVRMASIGLEYHF